MSKMLWASGEGEPHGKEEADKGSCGHGGHDDFQALVPNRRGGLGLGGREIRIISVGFTQDIGGFLGNL